MLLLVLLWDFLGSKDIRVAMVEAGLSLGSAFLEQGLIDECYCYMSPMILGLELRVLLLSMSLLNYVMP